MWGTNIADYTGNTAAAVVPPHLLRQLGRPQCTRQYVTTANSVTDEEKTYFWNPNLWSKLLLGTCKYNSFFILWQTFVLALIPYSHPPGDNTSHWTSTQAHPSPRTQAKLVIITKKLWISINESMDECLVLEGSWLLLSQDVGAADRNFTATVLVLLPAPSSHHTPQQMEILITPLQWQSCYRQVAL